MRITASAGLTAIFYVSMAVSAAAQSGDAIAVPPAPPIVAAPQPAPLPAIITPTPAPPPGLVQTPVPPVNTDNGAGAAATPATPAGQAGQNQPSAAPNAWVPGQTATIGVLDKVDGGTSEVTIPVGSGKHIGDLQITVPACVTRPPGQIPDAAVFLVAQNPAATAAPPVYRGWLVRSEPGAAEVGDPSETFRVIGCS